MPTATDWLPWYDRWEAMQGCYVTQRLYRFALMLELAGLPDSAAPCVLDLGCGPGSLALRVVQRWPSARVLAVDADPVLLEMGRHIAAARSAPVEFLRADLRAPDWWRDHRSTFDLALSSTALHWLSAPHLERVYERMFRVLKPGGVFANADHIASNYPETQARYRRLLDDRQRAAFESSGSLTWEGYWDRLTAVLAGSELLEQREAAAVWEGDDDGLPEAFHLAALERCGFEKVEVAWRDLGDAVIVARKPAM